MPETTLKDIFLKLLLPITIIILIIMGSLFAWSSLTGLKISGKEATENISADTSGPYFDENLLMFYRYEGVTYPNPYFDPGMTQQQTKDYMNEKIMITGCEQCTSCSGIAGKAYKCGSCTKCGGLEEAVVNANYGTCGGCIDCSAGSCSKCAYCYDMLSESRFCRSLKDAIRQAYVLDKEIDVVTLARKEYPNLNDFSDLLSQCSNEQIKVRTSFETEGEVCYFDSSLTATNYWGTVPKYEAAIPNPSWGTAFISSPSKIGTEVINITISGEEHFGGWGDSETALSMAMVDVVKTSCEWNPDDNSCLVSVNNKIKSYGERQKIKDCSQDISADPCFVATIQLPKWSEAKDVGYSETIFLPTHTSGNIFVVPWSVNIGLEDVKYYLYPDENVFAYDNCVFGKQIDPEGKIKINLLENALYEPIGHVKLRLGNLRTDRQRNCEFNLYFCDSSAFANSTSESIIEIYDLFRTFEVSDTHFETQTSASYGYYEFDLDRDYSIAEIISATEQGFDYWFSYGLPFMYDSPISVFNIAQTNGLTDGDWNAQETSAISGCTALSAPDMTYMGIDATGKLIRYYCPNGICKNKLKIKVEFRTTSEKKIQPVVWFCGE